MHIKKNLAIAAAVAVLSVPALSATSANAASFKNESARNITLTHPVTAREVYQNPKGDYLNKVVGTHTFPAGDHVHVYSQGTNGINYNISDASNGYGKHLLEDSINTTPNKLASENSAINQNNSSSNNESANSSSITANNSNSNNSSNGELAQTGESNTGAKAGIVGAIAAMVSVAFAGVEKFFKRA